MGIFQATSALTVLVINALLCLGCEAFLLADNCPATAPCSCSGSTSHAFIICNNNQLTSVPQFHTTQLHSNDIIVLLGDNNLTTIPNNAFQNLGSIHAATIHVQLDSNMITNVEMYAFNGIESNVTILQLQKNQLTALPAAVGRLRSLDYLDITNNPLKILGTSVMRGIGQSLKTLYIDLQTFPIWPIDIMLLNRLEHLTISNMPYAHLEMQVFKGFEQSLLTLTVQKAPMLKKVPSAICQLAKLNLLSLEHFDGLSADDGSLFENCTLKDRSLSSLTFEFSNLMTFPDVFRIFPSITSLNLLGNSLDIIEAEVIPPGNAVAKIDLDSNKFKRIPSALNQMKNLTAIDLTNNAIVSIEDVDLTGLARLQTLHLTHNPLRYISNHAFDSNNQLAVLDLGNTLLKKIPIAVTSLLHLTNFDIHGSPISCSCDMAYLRGWKISSILSFDGKCTNSHADIRNFIMTSLQQCPQ